MTEPRNVYHRLGAPGGSGCEVSVLPINFKDQSDTSIEGELLDGGLDSDELRLLRTVCERFGVKWGQDEFGWWAASPKRTDTAWTVWRQDDGGHQYQVQTGLSEDRAASLVKEFEASNHKQTYWASRNKEA